MLGIISATAYAVGQSDHTTYILDIKRYQPLISVSIGPDFVHKGDDQLLMLLPPYQDHYTGYGAWETVADAGGFIGVEFTLTDKLSTQLGISGYVNSELTQQGHVWLFSVPQFDDLTYAYHVHHSRVMATGKILGTMFQYHAMHPYFSWEVGAAFNRVNGYQELSFTPSVSARAPFADHSQTSFVWGLGLGMDYNLSAHVRLGAGYQFADLGSASLGLTPAEATSQTLNLSHLYTNQLRFQLTYLI